MKYKVLVFATSKWKNRAEKHKRIAKLMMAGGAFEDVTFHTVLYFGGKPKLDGDRIDRNWFEETFSNQAKAKGYTHAIFSFSMAEGRRWGLESGVRALNFNDGDFFGESWVRSDEKSIVRFKDGSRRDRYEKSVPHEIGHELKNQELTTLEIHDFDYLDTINNIEQFYIQLSMTKEAQIKSLYARVADLTKKMLGMNGLLPLVQRKANAILMEMELLGHPMRITEGYRSIERQNQLYAQGRTTPGLIVTNAKGGESLHNYKVAADFVFRKEGYSVPDTVWQTFGHVAEKHGFEWGGSKSWIKAGLNDRPHAQMTLGYSLADFKNGKVDYLKFN